MKIGIINNAANYLKFNVNLGNYLKEFGNEVVFLNCDKYIKSQLKKYQHQTVDYPQSEEKTNLPYHESSAIVRYYKRLYNLKSTHKLIDNLNQEYQRAFSYLRKTHFDYILILNGSFSVETEACKTLGIKCFFFEHGYFPKCIQMDGNGVNIDASFSQLGLKSFLNFNYPSSDFNLKPDFKIIEIPQSKILRYITRLSDKRYNENILSFFRKKINNEKAAKRFKQFEIENLDLEKFKPFIFFPLQVNSDTQIILNSPYNSMYEAIEDVLPALKSTGYKIIIKEHPLEVEPVDYSSFTNGEQVILTRKASLDELILHSEFVVNINSSVGLQSIAKNKKVLVLGDSFYNNAPSALNYQTISKDLKEEMKSVRVDEDLILKYIHHFKGKIFIPGHFYTPDVPFLERIRNRLV